MRHLFTFAILFFAVASCSPLRKVQQTQHRQTELSDSLLTHLVREEVSRSLQNFRQVEVEFFPPPDATLPAPESFTPAEESFKTPAPVQPVKRIVVTSLSTQTENLSNTDSTATLIHEEAIQEDTETKTSEKPSEGLHWFRGVIILLGMILLLIIIIKIRI